jgi:hypothetical protein
MWYRGRGNRGARPRRRDFRGGARFLVRPRPQHPGSRRGGAAINLAGEGPLWTDRLPLAGGSARGLYRADRPPIGPPSRSCSGPLPRGGGPPTYPLFPYGAPRHECRWQCRPSVPQRRLPICRFKIPPGPGALGRGHSSAGRGAGGGDPRWRAGGFPPPRKGVATGLSFCSSEWRALAAWGIYGPPRVARGLPEGAPPIPPARWRGAETFFLCSGVGEPVLLRGNAARSARGTLFSIPTPVFHQGGPGSPRRLSFPRKFPARAFAGHPFAAAFAKEFLSANRGR